MLSPLDVESLMTELRLDEELFFEDNFFTNALKDKIIIDIFIDSLDYPRLLTFKTDKGFVSFETEGDCCSDCWFADFFNVKNIIGHTVLGTNEIDLEEHDYNLEDGRCLQDTDIVYGFKIYTDGDIGVLSFRDSSNGYYGGWMNLVKEHTTNHSLKEYDNWISEF